MRLDAPVDVPRLLKLGVVLNLSMKCDRNDATEGDAHIGIEKKREAVYEQGVL